MIGAGNVAHHLGHQFHKNDIDVVQVYSRKIRKAKKLAKSVSAEPVNDLNALNNKANVIIIAVHDDAIDEVAQQIQLKLERPLIVHTSGSVPSKVLKPYFKNYGCFYPLQSFTIGKEVDFEQLPICISSPQSRNRKKLFNLAKAICPNVYEITDNQKSILHVAAVFANNFTNYLYDIAYKITKNEGIDFNVLKPLILETATKIKDNTPSEMQTGPARRGDQKTIDKHLEYLNQHPDWKQLYQLLSKGIEKEF